MERAAAVGPSNLGFLEREGDGRKKRIRLYNPSADVYLIFISLNKLVKAFRGKMGNNKYKT